MNDYLSAVVSGNPYVEAPNDWSRMLMNVADYNNSWSAEQAQKQMDFQERMSNTAHQREIADLKASGLNPVLSAKLGGASTPSGASATADSSIVNSLVNLMGKMLEVQGTSAAAAYNASGGYEATYGDSTYNSGQSNSEDGYKYPNNFANPNNKSGLDNSVSKSDVSPLLTAASNLLGIPGLAAAGDAVASFINGANGQPNPKGNNASGAYNAGQKYANASKNFGRPDNIKEKNQSAWNKVKNALSTASAKMSGTYNKPKGNGGR